MNDVIIKTNKSKLIDNIITLENAAAEIESSISDGRQFGDDCSESEDTLDELNLLIIELQGYL